MLRRIACAIIGGMKSVRHESGLINIFRLFLLVQLFLIIGKLHVHSVRGMLPADVAFAIVFASIAIAVLFGYLSWPWLRTKLDPLFLPLAIVFSATLSVTVQNLFLNVPLSVSERGSEEAAWQLFLFLFVPLILVGWQYGFRSVTAYCLFTTALDYAMVRLVDANFAAIDNTFHRLLLIRFLSFMFAGYILSRIMQQLRRERHALEEANRKLGRYVAALEQLTVSRERNRMARELHDVMAHTLSGMAVQLEAASALWASDRDGAYEMVRHSLKAARSGLTETRRAIQSLRATPLEDLGLAQALREFAETAADRTGFRLELKAPGDLGVLPPEVEQCFYRIGQEAVENASRHAQAHTLLLRISRSPSTLFMEVADDGRGFDGETAEEERHFGLQGMRERAEIIGASFDLSSGPGRGTRVVLSWSEGGRRTK